MIKNLKIKYKLFLLLLLSVLLILSISIYSLMQITRLADPIANRIPTQINTIKTTSKLDNLAQLIKYYDEVLTQSARNYAFTGDKKWKVRYKDVEPKLDSIINEAIKKGDQKDKVFFDTVNIANLALVKLEYQSIELVDNKDKEGAVRILEGAEYAGLKEEYKNGLEEYVNRRGSEYEKDLEITTTDLNSTIKEAKVITSSAYTTIVIVTILVIIFTIIAGLVIIQQILKPLSKLIKGAKEIGEGNLNYIIDINSNDEIGLLTKAFNQMSIKIRESQESLEQKIKERTKEAEEARSKLAGQVGGLEKNNVFLKQSQDALANVLEDAKELEEQLKIEKASVERKVMERTKELNEERIKLSASISSLTLGFIMTDRNNNIVTINQAARNMLCASANSLLATVKDCTLIHIEDELKGTIDLRALIDRSVSKKQALLVKQLEFQGRFLKILITPIMELANVIGCVVLVDDITEAKILERSRDEFFSIASHELRTPLTAIRGNTSMIKEFYGDKIKDPELKDMISDIHESSVRLIEIVNDFLDTSRLEQGKMEFKRAPIDLVNLITSVIKEYQVTGSRKKLAIEYHPDEKTSVPKVFADPDKAKQVLINLIGNSLKFTEQGGVTITTQVLKGFVKIFVMDTGRGISQANQKLIFHKFQQANTSLLTRDASKGTGLGLYISKLIIKGMGGEIGLESSAEGKGTTFSFSLPIVSAAQLDPKKVSSERKIDSATGLIKS